MKRIVHIADDFGSDPAVNLAIVEAHTRGALHGASLMTGQPATAHAVGLARQNPTLLVGWHAHLCDSQPATRAAWPWGRSPALAGLAAGAWLPLVRRELRAQWALFEQTGLECAFVNAHHHLHVHPAVLRELGAVLPASFRGWIRGFNVRPFSRGLPPGARLIAAFGRGARCRLPGGRTPECSGTLWGLDRFRAMDAAEIRRACASLGPGLHEFLYHPRGGGDDPDLAALVALREDGIAGI